jgi:hypothetical protein
MPRELTRLAYTSEPFKVRAIMLVEQLEPSDQLIDLRATSFA